jgi:RNA 3'-terminal phosphate cyclase (ATP)
MLTLDGAAGEGGGQILRTALGLSLVTGTPFLLENIRARRRRPGLARQHLAAVRAAARIGDASTEGAELGSRRLAFEPGAVAGGTFEFSTDGAGSTSLVLQAVLPALLCAPGPTRLTLRGGTHNPLAPPFEFLERAYLPLLRRMGAGVEARLLRHGFNPAGGGAVEFRVEPAPLLEPLELVARGRIVAREAIAMVARLPDHIARRELDVVAKRLGWTRKELHVRDISDSAGPGNALVLIVESDEACEVVTTFGEIGLPAETVARRAVRAMQRFLQADVPVGEHLADQLMVPLAMAGGGRYRTLPLTGHARTNAEVIGRFLPVRVDTSVEGEVTIRA